MATLFYLMKCGEHRGEKGRKNEHQTTKKSQKPKIKSKGKIMGKNLEPKKKKKEREE